MIHPAVALFTAGAGAALGAGRGWLTVPGAVAATLVGGATLIGAGWPGAIPLTLFFVSGSILTSARLRADEGRTARQVVANGGWAAAAALLVATDPLIGWCGVTGALAAAQADTWASEVGRRIRPTARRITTGQRVPAGRSGAVTAIGTLVGAAGAVLMGLAAVAVGAPAVAGAAGIAAGIGGMVADSLLGDTLQGDEPGLAGPAWFTNDLVNFVATGTAAVAAAGIGWGSARLR